MSADDEGSSGKEGKRSRKGGDREGSWEGVTTQPQPWCHRKGDGLGVVEDGQG